MGDSSASAEHGATARPTSLQPALRAAARTLQAAGVASPLNDARLIAAHLLGCEPLDTLFYDEVPAGFWERVERRATREPIQYILGTAPFGPLDIAVGPGVFIPRPETESLAEWGAREASASACPGETPTVVDLCSGSGAVAAYIAHAVPQAAITAVELSVEAAEYARRNAAPFGVEVLQGDATNEHVLDDASLTRPGDVDVITANPPYVPNSPDLSPEVYSDPEIAVFSGADGMDLIRRMVPVIGTLLAPGGIAAVEHDDTTSQLVQNCFARDGRFTDIGPLKDLTGVNRFVVARKLASR